MGKTKYLLFTFLGVSAKIKKYFFLFTIFIVSSSIFLIPQVRAQSTQVNFRLQLQVKKYFEQMRGFSNSINATGVLIGDIQSNNISSSTNNLLEFGDTQHVCYAIPFTDSCLSEADYGWNVKWTFSAKGQIIYHYNVPYKFVINLPKKVYPGQRIRFEPNITWQKPIIDSTQDFEYYHTSSSWFDIPDGFDSLSFSFTQYAASANLNGAIPLHPYVDATHFDENISFYPFDQGGGQWPIDDPASKTILGGKGSQRCSGGSTDIVNQVDAMPSISVFTSCKSGSLWQQNTEYFKLLNTILSYTPAAFVVPAFEIVRAAGQFRLNESINGKIHRTDVVNVQLSEAPYMNVPSNIIPGENWVINVPVKIKYRVQSKSLFSYPLSYALTYSSILDGNKQIANEPLESIPAGESDFTSWENHEDSLTITGTVPIISQSEYMNDFITISKDPIAFAYPQRNMNVHPSGIKIANPQNTKRISHTNLKVPFPKPSVEQGFPLSGQYTVIIGKTSPTMAVEIINELKNFGISSFTLNFPSTKDKGITLGSFLKEKDAQLVSYLLKKGFNLDSVVQSSIDLKSFQPINSNLLAKLRSKKNVQYNNNRRSSYPK